MQHLSTLLFVLVLLCAIICECKLYEKEKFKNSHRNKLSRTYNRENKDALVLTKYGKVQGKQNVTSAGTKYFAFQGIPYAKPPVGKLRFEPPQPTRWESVWNATYERNVCMQSDMQSMSYTGDEDCLYLNIYTPELPNIHTGQGRAVMVYVSGGAFSLGSGNYDIYGADYFLDENLVVVLFNYRLGVFGFLSTGDKVVPGNMGLKDQLFVLEWLKKNIRFFGGDPENITIMGESAGAVSISYLIQSPLSKGLFKRAIMQSGNSLCGWGISRKAIDNAKLLGRSFGVVGTSREIVDRLRSIDSGSLHYASQLSMGLISIEDPLNGFVYAPVIEAGSQTAVISKKSFEQLSSCNFNTVPILIGFNSEEGIFFESVVQKLRLYLLKYDVIPRGLVPIELKAGIKCNVDALGDAIKNFYVGKAGTFLMSSRGFQSFISDNFFVRPTTEYVKLYSNCSAKTYFYRFSYKHGNDVPEVGHAEELLYLFSSNVTKSEKFLQNSRRMVQMWSDFIKMGTPTPKKTDGGVTWMPASASNDYSYLDIGYDLVTKNQTTSPHRKQLNFWDEIYQKCGTGPYDTYKK